MTEHWIWLALRRGIGPVGAGQLMDSFGSAEAIYSADAETLSRAGLDEKTRTALLDKDLSGAERILDACLAGGIRVLHPGDGDYPERLRQTGGAPSVLYCVGRLPDFSKQPCIGAVGTRRANAWGLHTARQLGWQIAGCGGVLATGMAAGIDGEAARGALDRGGRVIGVLGCGVDVIYPKENRAVFERVAEQGCLISEHPPGAEPRARNFPARNRIISALSDGVVVVQAGERSGALITARWAADQGRDVFAVPGPAGEALSCGCNRLLRDGAILAECGWDVMREYAYRYPAAVREYHGRPEPRPEPVSQPAPAAPPEQSEKPVSAAPKAGSEGPAAPQPDLSRLEPVQRRIAEQLLSGPMQLDALIDALRLPAARVLSQLTLMEVRGQVVRAPGKIYTLSQSKAEG